MTGDTISWLGHSSLRLDTGDDTRIYIDPWLTNPKCPAAEREPERIDVIALTHGTTIISEKRHLNCAASTDRQSSRSTSSAGGWRAARIRARLPPHEQRRHPYGPGCPDSMTDARRFSSLARRRKRRVLRR